MLCYGGKYAERRKDLRKAMDGVSGWNRMME